MIREFIQAGFISVIAYAVFRVGRFFLWCRKLSKSLQKIKGVSANPHWLWGDFLHIKKAGSLTDFRAAVFDQYPEDRFLKAYLGPMPVLMSREYDFFKFVTNNQTGSPTPFAKVDSAALHILIGSNNVICLDGSEWALHRSKLTKLFSVKNLQTTVDFCNTLYDRMEKLLDNEIAAQSSKTQSAVIDFEPYAKQLASGSILNLVFSLDVGALKEDVHISPPPMIAKFDAAEEETDRLMRLPPFMTNWPIPARIKLYQRCREADQEFQAIIQKRRDMLQNNPDSKRGEGHDALDILLDPTIQPPFSDEAVHDDLMGLCWAGGRPPALLMSWCAYYLGKYPEHQETMFEEVANLPRPFTYDDISRCEFVDRFINEVQRVVAIAPVLLRQSTTDATYYNGLQLPKGLWILNSMFDMHRDPAYFERPEIFDPERELASNPKYNPYSAGEKRCLGMKFARIEVRAFLAALVRDYRLELIPGANYKPRRHILISPEAGITVRIHKRR